jgi:hypothetical protein
LSLKLNLLPIAFLDASFDLLVSAPFFALSGMRRGPGDGPTGTPSRVGPEQAVATNRASSLPNSFRWRAGARGSSVSAAAKVAEQRSSRSPDARDNLVVTPTSAASEICARLSLRTECVPALRSALSSSGSP